MAASETNEVKMEPLAIVKYVEIKTGNGTTRKLHLDVEPLCKLLLQPHVQDLPVVVISINGRMRSGKTFLLNQKIKFLKADGNPGWIDFPLEFEFKWSDSKAPVTSGIEIYPEVLTFTVGKQKIAVILMDTQGTFDGNSETSDTNKIFGLSALISSVIIYNDKVCDDQNFQSLHGFIKFTQFARADDSDDNGDSCDDFKFGKLNMLYRDWGHVTEFPYGFYPKRHPDPVKEHLWRELMNREKLTPESANFRTSILNSFQDVSFYAMASPGNRYPHLPRYRHSSSWSKTFRSCVIHFVENLFSEAYIKDAVKNVGGQEMIAKDYVPHIRSWARAISNNNYNLKLVDPIDASAEIYYKPVLERSLEMYTNKFMEFRCRDYEGNVDDFHQEALEMVEKKLWGKVSYKPKRKTYFKKLRKMASDFLGESREQICKVKEAKRKYLEEVQVEKRAQFKRNLILGAAAVGVGVATGGTCFVAIAAAELAISGCAGAAGAVITFALGKTVLSFFKKKPGEWQRPDDDVDILARKSKASIWFNK